MRTKGHRFGITRKDAVIELNLDMGMSGPVVTTLIALYLNKGHSVYTDNWYSSPSLSLFLHILKTNSCGTVQGKRKGIPPLT